MTRDRLDFSTRNWPSPTQLLLLKACVGPDPEAVDAWRQWQTQVAFDDIDYGSQRLIPMLYHNLRRLGVDDPIFGRYRGLYRRSWYENQMIFQRGAQLLRQLAAAGIPTMVLKGPALSHLYYPETALRPMSDFDILVPHEYAAQTVAAFRTWGFERKPGDYLPLPPRPFAVRHSCDYLGKDGSLVDLHWRALKTSLGPDTDRPFWADSEALELAGVPTRVLNATDQLLHACIHGIPFNVVAPMRWTVDVLMILRHRQIDWQRLLQQTRTQHASIMMHQALTYVRENLNAPVPEQVIDELAAIPAAGWERKEFAIITLPRRSRATHRWFGLVIQFRRIRQMTPVLARLPLHRAYLLFLLDRWNLETSAELLSLLVRKAGSNVVRKLRGSARHRPRPPAGPAGKARAPSVI